MALHYQVIRPSAALARHVQCYWVLEGEACPDPHILLPDGFVEIVFARGEGAVVVGQMCRPRTGPAQGRFRWLGARLRPESAHRFFAVPQTELSDRITRLEDLWGPAARDWAEANGPDVEWALYRQLRPRASAPGVDRAVHLILASGGTVNMHGLAREAAMSGRNLERSFRERVGLPPKTLARVMRFQRTLWALEQSETSWASVAAACGYYDQAHLVRDFREFAGQTPSDYRRCAVEISQAAQGHRNPKFVGFLQDFTGQRDYAGFTSFKRVFWLAGGRNGKADS